jgi:hypothetical protein
MICTKNSTKVQCYYTALLREGSQRKEITKNGTKVQERTKQYIPKNSKVMDIYRILKVRYRY